jgi:adenosylcobyric acid synthase
MGGRGREDAALGLPDLIVLPGTKHTIGDLQHIKASGLAGRIRELASHGTPVIGICGGYQLLGKLIRDPYGIEGTPGETYCLGFLDVETTLHREKILSRSKGIWERSGENVEGYEIHMGITECGPGVLPLIRILSKNERPDDSFDGASSPEGRVWGTYFHGLFDVPGFRHSFLKAICTNYKPGENNRDTGGASNFKDHHYDLLAEHFRAHLDMEKLFKIVGFDEETCKLIGTF